MAEYSVAKQFHGSVVFVTGATGYIGGLVLEKLLRTTDVDLVYVLLRPKPGCSAKERLALLLQKSIFHLLRDQQQLLNKVKAVTGDITLPGLGLATSSKCMLEQQTDIILHCAADIRLEVDIHSALTANYCGTEAVLQLAAGCERVRALVHISSCFVNMNQPRSSVIDEQLYPLKFGETPVDCQALVQDLLALPADAANTRATALGLRWGFPNNYTFSKHLAEQLVWQYHQQGVTPMAIVRPSLVCSVAYEPIPGYIGNWAGPIGAAAALAIGFYHSLSCVSSEPLHIWDCMPADMVANAILATAAAVTAGCSSSIATQAAATAAETSQSTVISSSNLDRRMLIVHSSSSSTYPMTLMEGWNYALEFIQVHKPKFRLSWGKLPKMTPSFQPNPKVVRRERRWTAFKVRLACSLLKLFGLQRAAARLANGFDALCIYGTSKTDKDLVFSAHTLQFLEQQLPSKEQQQYRLVMRPGMPLPKAVIVGGGLGDSQQSGTAQAALNTEAEPLLTSQQQQAGVLTWRRYYHSQLAAVYSMLFRVSTPQIAYAAKGAVIEHDFRFLQ